MPRRTDINRILIIGSGPIIIGQAAEFDYSGSQACKALREEGYEVILVNSNPATIMTDPEMADRSYIEPLVPEILEKIIVKEKPNALLSTLGGQIGLNLSTNLSDKGVLKKHNVELIGAKIEAIKKAEDRDLFRKSMKRIGIETPKSSIATSVDEAVEAADSIGYPVVVRPAFTLGGTGGGLSYNREELKKIAQRGIQTSMIKQILVEEGVVGWKEYELEVMRDLANNVVIICSIENMDPMGIHTGDSITVAPAQTLTDKEYQTLRDAAIKIIREIGVETGGSNIQFAVEPHTGRFVAIEMNPRVSRSSALASKATGYPIAKIAAKLAVGYTLDEIPNDITGETRASFEPTIDYTVVKIPRFTFEKFPGVDTTLTTQMKSVGEIMAIGRTFEEALQKALRSLEIGRFGLGSDRYEKNPSNKEIIRNLQTPNCNRVFYIRYALKRGFTIDDISSISKIDPWFIEKIDKIVKIEEQIRKYSQHSIPVDLIREAKRTGFSDAQLAYLLKKPEKDIMKIRKTLNIQPIYKMVDTCAAEFDAKTPYYYSTYEKTNEAIRTNKKKIVIIGSGPNRIGQGIEFDYCCVHGLLSLRDEDYETIMINCNPETVSTDYDVSNRLYFEPITHEDVINIFENEKPSGIIIQLGGQTPLNISSQLKNAGVTILGTSSNKIDIAEDRKRFAKFLNRLHIPQPANGTAYSIEEAELVAKKIGYPLLVRPSYVLGGRGMAIVYNRRELKRYIKEATIISPDKPILIDKFLEDAIEAEVDALCDGENVLIGGIMEHIEEAGVHSGDSACVLPPTSLPQHVIQTMKEYTREIALKLRIIGLINIQYAIKDEITYVLEANPRASRTVPFVSKATGIPLAKLAAKIMIGKKLTELKIIEKLELKHSAVKEALFPFNRFYEVDPVLSPEMRSTGEVMGIADEFGLAYYKAELAAGMRLPIKGTALISVKNKDKPKIVEGIMKLTNLGFRILASKGTAEYLTKKGIEVETVHKLVEGRPNIIDRIINNEIDFIINTPKGARARTDDYYIRRAAVDFNIPYITTIPGALAAVKGIETIKTKEMTIKAIQDYHRESII